MGNITHATTPLTIDGVEYEFSPITLEDLEYLDTWVRSRVIEAARMSLSDDASQEQIKATLLAANEAAAELSVFSGKGIQQLMQPIGAARFTMRLLKRKQPTVTAAMCFSWMMRPDVRVPLQAKLLDLFKSATNQSAPGEGQGSDPTTGNGGPSTKVPSSDNSSQQA